MSDGDQKPTASSWRDVYDLVRDTRADLMVAVGNVDTKVTELGERVTGIEQDRRDEKVARETEAILAAARDAAAVKRAGKIVTILGAGRSTVALIISIASFVLVVLKS
jgi:hypothetical protein